MKRIIKIIPILLILYGCTKRVKVPFPEEFKPYIAFNIGSFWVYKDSISNLIYDSIELKQTLYYSTYRGFEFTKYEYEHLSQTYFSARKNKLIYTYTDYGEFKGYRISNTIGDFYSWGLMPKSDSLNVNQTWYKNISLSYNGDTVFYWIKNIGLIKITYKNNLGEKKVFQLTNYLIK